MGKFSVKKVSKSVNKIKEAAKPVAQVAQTVTKPVAQVAQTATKQVAQVATKVAAPMAAVAAVAVKKSDETEKKLIAQIAEKNKRIQELEESLNTSKNSLNLSKETIAQRMVEINALKDEQDGLYNTLNTVQRKNENLSHNNSEMIFKSYAPIDENQKREFNVNIKKALEGFSLIPKKWKRRFKPKRKPSSAQPLNMIAGGTVPVLAYGANVIEDQQKSIRILNAELKNNNAALDFIDATNLTGVPYKYAVTANQNQLIDNQIATNKDLYTTDMRKTEYKTYKIEWLEFINKILFYLYYLIGFYCIFKIALNSQSIAMKVVFAMCIFIYPFVIGKIERVVLFIFNFLKSFLLGNAIDEVEGAVKH
jgi:hypothetical protein